MFDPSVYCHRRDMLKQQLRSGLVLFPGHSPSPINFEANPYPFRQDSSFLYYGGPNQPNCTLLIDIDDDQETLHGPEASPDDIVWTGRMPSMAERAEQAGIRHSGSTEQVETVLRKARADDRPIHYLPAYRPDQMLALSQWLAVSPRQVNHESSLDLIRAVVVQRSIKAPEEIAEIESALGLSRMLFQAVVKALRHDKNGVGLAGTLEGIVKSAGRRFAFPPIITSHGEILHNRPDNHPFGPNDLLLVDMGAESREHYASDVTRTMPVGGQFSQRQREIYEIVLAAQKAAIAQAKTGIKFVDLHRLAAETICAGLGDIGLMRGSVEEAVSAGAHALFFPHGLGHMLGLDVHDMESLGEDHVGYDAETKRSDQFGLAALRLGRRLESNFVVTIEPGIYFIPALIDQWRQEGRCASFIAFDKLEPYRRFGGLRIEDVVRVTPEGGRVLGPVIPKAVATVEAAWAG